MAENETKGTSSGEKGVNPSQIDAKETEAKKTAGEAEVEPIKPGDRRVARSSSLLGTCYSSTDRPSRPPED